MRFWDASAIVPLLLEEDSSHSLSSLLKDDAGIMVWWATRVEVASAFARLRRDNRLTQEELKDAILDARNLLVVAVTIEPSTQLAERAERLVFNHELRAADALQLAAALIGVQERPQGFGFVSLDHRLRDAAAREGYAVSPS